MNKILLKILLSLAFTGGLVSASLIPAFYQKDESGKNDFSKLDLSALKNHSWKFDESTSSNSFGFKSINSVAKKIIKESNNNINLDEITITTYLGNFNNENQNSNNTPTIITPTDVPIFINKFTIFIESEKYNTKEMIYVNNNFSLLNLNIATNFNVYFGNTRPLDSKKWGEELFNSINDFFLSQNKLNELSKELYNMGFLTREFNFITNPFYYSPGDHEFNISNLEYTAGYSLLTFKETDPNYKFFVNYGILADKGETNLTAKFDVTFFDKKNEYHDKVVGLKDGIIDKGIKQVDRFKNNDFLKFEYNDNTTIEEINKFLPTLLVRSEAYNHSSWFVNPDKFKFSYWTTASSSGRKYLSDEKISDLWGFSSGKPYFAVKIDSVNDEYVSYKDISFNIYFKTGGLTWDGSDYYGN